MKGKIINNQKIKVQFENQSAEIILSRFNILKTDATSN